MSEKNKIENQEQNNSAVVHQSISFSGPLPPPEVLQKFDEVHPGAAKIIIDMAKNQSEHRQKLEKEVINSDIKNSKLGLVFGFIIGMTGIIAGALIIFFGQAFAGGFLSFISLGSLVGTFVYGSQGRKKEREEKKKED